MIFEILIKSNEKKIWSSTKCFHSKSPTILSVTQAIPQASTVLRQSAEWKRVEKSFVGFCSAILFILIA